MTALPTEVALAIAGAGVDIQLDEDALIKGLRGAIADRAGYVDGPERIANGWRVELLAPVRMTFEGRTPVQALAWCLI